ncbi:MAG: nucleoside-diphosphate sugar epimerase/dehydratase [Candidatus Ozemobacteraceae bacterium]
MLLRNSGLILIDGCCTAFALWAALYLRYEGFDPTHGATLSHFLPFFVPAALSIFWMMGLYARSLRFTSIPDMIAVFNAVTLGSLLKLSLIYFDQTIVVSRSVVLLDWLINLLLISTSRVSPRLLLNVAEFEPFRTLVYGEAKNHPKRVLVFGAGRAGESIIREIKRNENLPFTVVGFLDDDPKQRGKYIHGIKVLGDRNALNQVIVEHSVEEIIIAIPSAQGSILREIVKLCRDSKIRFKTLPGLQDLIDGKLTSLQLKDIAIEDLLRRPSAEINLAEIAAYLTDKVVLVTGAGGSIGSEICRQIMVFCPRKLLLVGHGENSIYLIHQELGAKLERGKTQIFPLIADVQDPDKLENIFRQHRPHIIFHAAAHKHVPLMESNPGEAVKNNVFGTRNLVSAADRFGAERFVMISTDKAVNPTSVMGATKRVAEMIMKCYAKRSSTRFVAVRFGNVLGSRGSVIPLFKRQIEQGGPITITHPNMIRYFMTIPEASKLVIQAGSYGKGGEVFILDMGDPVKIADLAADLIRLAGLEEGKDIHITYSGLRPGEKLYEELLTAEEGIAATRNKKIFIARPEDVDESVIMPKVNELILRAQTDERKRIVEMLQSLLPSFAPDRDAIFNDYKSHAREDVVSEGEKPKAVKLRAL